MPKPTDRFVPSRESRNHGIDNRPGAPTNYNIPRGYWEYWLDPDGNELRVPLSDNCAQHRPSPGGLAWAADARRRGWLPIEEIADDEYDAIKAERQRKANERGDSLGKALRPASELAAELVATRQARDTAELKSEIAKVANEIRSSRGSK